MFTFETMICSVVGEAASGQVKMQPSAKSVEEVLSGLYSTNPPSLLFLSLFFFIATELKILLSSKEGSLWSRGQTYYVAREKSIKLRQALKKMVM